PRSRNTSRTSSAPSAPDRLRVRDPYPEPLSFVARQGEDAQAAACPEDGGGGDDEEGRDGEAEGDLRLEERGDGDLVGDGLAPLLDGEALGARYEAADQRLPDEGVDDADRDRVAGDDAEQQEDGGVGDARDERAGGEAGGDAVFGAHEDPGGDVGRHGREDGHQRGGHGELGLSDDGPGDRLGDQVDDGAVVDLGRDHAGGGDEAEQRQERADGEVLHQQHGGALVAAAEEAEHEGQGDQREGQQEQQHDPAPAQQRPVGDACHDGVHVSCSC